MIVDIGAARMAVRRRHVEQVLIANGRGSLHTTTTVQHSIVATTAAAAPFVLVLVGHRDERLEFALECVGAALFGVAGRRWSEAGRHVVAHLNVVVHRVVLELVRVVVAVIVVVLVVVVLVGSGSESGRSALDRRVVVILGRQILILLAAASANIGHLLLLLLLLRTH